MVIIQNMETVGADWQSYQGYINIATPALATLWSYTETDPVYPIVLQPPNLKSYMHLLPALDMESFKSRVGKKLVGPLMKISNLDSVNGAC